MRMQVNNSTMDNKSPQISSSFLDSSRTARPTLQLRWRSWAFRALQQMNMCISSGSCWGLWRCVFALKGGSRSLERQMRSFIVIGESPLQTAGGRLSGRSSESRFFWTSSSEGFILVQSIVRPNASPEGFLKLRVEERMITQPNWNLCSLRSSGLLVVSESGF